MERIRLIRNSDGEEIVSCLAPRKGWINDLKATLILMTSLATNAKMQPGKGKWEIPETLSNDVRKAFGWETMHAELMGNRIEWIEINMA